MSWSRPLAAAVSGLLLCGCVATGNAQAAAPATGSTAAAPGREKPVLMLNGSTEARPGQLVDIMLEGVSGARSRYGVTATSPAFHSPTRLRWHQDEDAYEAVVPLSMTDKPGWYPLAVAVGGHVVARDKIQIVRSQRPSLSVTASAAVARPGEQVAVRFDDLYPGETGSGFTVRSAALPKPARLARDQIGDFYNPRAFSAQPELKPDLTDGTYTFELYGPRGRITEQRLTVRAARPGDADYLGKARGPAFFTPHGSPEDAREHGYKVPAGGRVEILWHDVYPDAGEDTRLVATSPAFTHPVKLQRDESKGADGDDPRYFNLATMRTDLRPGSYPVTVVAHHGRVRMTNSLVVTAASAPSRSMAAGPGTGWLGAVGGALVLAAIGVATTLRRRRPTTGH
ncbi:hypothetical protein [Streptantibioticus ferralitis]|uniref:Uncharacterized protein n=1 Tax=Streptantibioticus ferralitis TaxID=236510 RepID=A0ABT5YSB8_9ACTN|nr:hypothetical protein [Streptantibioticus ferralitis]MDF2254251.1 hypothetical protein [Streptantibioticus ferralitis]